MKKGWVGEGEIKQACDFLAILTPVNNKVRLKLQYLPGETMGNYFRLEKSTRPRKFVNFLSCFLEPYRSQACNKEI